MKGTNILVVMGYSFPYFNSVIDRKIVSEMNHLQKTYIQFPNGKKIKERMRAVMDISNKEFALIDDDLSQLVLPFAL